MNGLPEPLAALNLPYNPIYCNSQSALHSVKEKLNKNGYVIKMGEFMVFYPYRNSTLQMAIYSISVKIFPKEENNVLEKQL